MLLALGLFSWFFHFVQEQKHTGARKRLLDEVVAGQNQSQGATKMTLDLRRYVSHYTSIS